MKSIFLNKKINVVIKSNDLDLNTIVVECTKGNKEVHIFRKMGNGTLKELKKVRSEEKSQVKNEAIVEKVSDSAATSTPDTNNVATVDEGSKREISWRKFRTAVVKAGGIDAYMKSRRKDSAIDALLLKHPDFKRGMKLYEAGSKGAWALMTAMSIESVRRIYRNYFMDLDAILAA